MDLSDVKTAARNAAFAARKQAFGQGLDAAAQAHLLAYLANHPKAGIVSGYMPIRTEIDPLPVMQALVSQGRRLCVPVIDGANRPLLFREWLPGCALVNGPFGAMVPETGDFLQPDMLIAPLLAFDLRGYRLGYGGGFYDRTLELLRAERPTLAVGFAYGAQQIPEVPIESTDQRLDAIVTEAGQLPLHPALPLDAPTSKRGL